MSFSPGEPHWHNGPNGVFKKMPHGFMPDPPAVIDKAPTGFSSDGKAIPGAL